MADVKMPESIPCQFDAKGSSPCRKPSTNGWCSKHEGARCASCGEHAVRACESEIGGLLCGSSLCKTCDHSLDDNRHVTKDVRDMQTQERDEFLRTGQESKRMLAMHGIPTDVEFPRHLKELLETGRESYELTTCYFLRIKVNTMGMFPAVKKGTQILLLTPSKSAAIRVWASLEPRDSELVSELWLVHREHPVGYLLSSDPFDQKQNRPHRIFSEEEISAMFSEDDHPFRWTPGIILGAGISDDCFEQLIRKNAA